MSNSFDQIPSLSPVPLSSTPGKLPPASISPTQMLSRIKEYMNFTEQNRSISPSGGSAGGGGGGGGGKKKVDDVLKRLANKRNDDAAANSSERTHNLSNKG